MNKKIFYETLYIGLILALIVFMIWIYFFMQSEAGMCLKSPISYFEGKNKGAYCTCFKEGDVWDQGALIPEDLKIKTDLD